MIQNNLYPEGYSGIKICIFANIVNANKRIINEFVITGYLILLQKNVIVAHLLI